MNENWHKTVEYGKALNDKVIEYGESNKLHKIIEYGESLTIAC